MSRSPKSPGKAGITRQQAASGRLPGTLPEAEGKDRRSNARRATAPLFHKVPLASTEAQRDVASAFPGTKKVTENGGKLARPAGFEPATPSLEMACPR